MLPSNLAMTVRCVALPAAVRTRFSSLNRILNAIDHGVFNGRQKSEQVPSGVVLLSKAAHWLEKLAVLEQI
jgi:hypothetical protein